MGQLTNYLEKKILDHVLKTTSYAPPATVYLALFSATPGPTGGGTEVAYTNYARQPIYFGFASSRSIAQNAQVNFPQCGTTGDTAAYWGLYDALTSGNLLAYGALAASKSIVSGNTPTVASGQVTVSFNSGAIFTAFANTLLNWLFAGSYTLAYTGGTGAQPVPGTTVTGATSGATATLKSVGGTWGTSGTLYLTNKSAAFTSGETLNIPTGSGVSCTNAQGGDAVSVLPQPSNVNVGLSTTTPTDAGGNITEPSNGYSRQAFNLWYGAVVTGSAEIAKNDGTITMPTPSGSWGTITYSFLALDTTLAFYGALGTPQAPGSGDTVEWLDSQYTVQIQ
jgi:hypothetical protein